MTEIRALRRILQIPRQLTSPWKQSGPLYVTLVKVDIQSFGDPARTQQHREEMVTGLRTALNEALSKTLREVGERLRACKIEFQGDDALVLIPGRIASSVILTYLPDNLARELRKYNATRCAEAQIKLRAAVHVGPVPDLVSCDAVILASHLVDAEALKAALRDSKGSVLGMVASTKIYDEIIKQDPATNPTSFVEIPVEVKQTKTTGWMCLLS